MLAEIAPRTREIFLDEMEWERVVAGRHRRVCREDRRAPHFFQRIVEGAPLLDHLADALQRHECGVALVQVEDGGVDAHRS